jgi:hypothetical protein
MRLRDPPASRPPTNWGELVQVHDDRAIFQASPDELPVIDIHSLRRDPMPRCGWPLKRAVSRPVCADEKNPALSVDRRLLGTSTIGPHLARSVPAVAPHDPPRSADACRSAIGHPTLSGSHRDESAEVWDESAVRNRLRRVRSGGAAAARRQACGERPGSRGRHSYCRRGGLISIFALHRCRPSPCVAFSPSSSPCVS